jgi:hypothetical protein
MKIVFADLSDCASRPGTVTRGAYNADTDTIVINSALSPRDRAGTFVHEVFHATGAARRGTQEAEFGARLLQEEFLETGRTAEQIAKEVLELYSHLPRR